MKKEYAFELYLFAVVRVTAESEAKAREYMDDRLSCCAPEDSLGLMDLREFSLATRGAIEQPKLIEVDGKEV